MISQRTKTLSSLIENTYIGCELGVAKGFFSYDILSYSNIKHLYSIDMWAGDRGHNILEYNHAIKLLSKFQHRNTILKQTFEDAKSLFNDNFFDFIYIDGYAHTGQDNGKTLYQWFDKLKIGGIFAGHDYDIHWPKTVEQVNKFMQINNKSINIIQDKPYNSWYIIK
jgi:hypothetical protein